MSEIVESETNLYIRLIYQLSLHQVILKIEFEIQTSTAWKRDFPPFRK